MLPAQPRKSPVNRGWRLGLQGRKTDTTWSGPLSTFFFWTGQREVSTMITCPFCHFENEDGALFCEQCKSDLAGVVPAPAAVPVAETIPIGATPVHEAFPVHEPFPMHEAVPVLGEEMPAFGEGVPMLAEAAPDFGETVPV